MKSLFYIFTCAVAAISAWVIIANIVAPGVVQVFEKAAGVLQP